MQNSDPSSLTPILHSLNIYCDGGARGNPGPAASAFLVYDSDQKLIHSQGFYLGVATNNQAEYQAVVESLKWLSTSRLALSTVNFYLDSELVIKQLTGAYKIKDQKLKSKNEEIKKIIVKCQMANIKFHHIPREQNFAADHLVNQILDTNAPTL